ncbi:hypothetical protein B551_0206175 [Cupriavidus sp. HPC(L)]|nr:hypothetical protein B551_0206175 [Cupriavidus sp. HPC(L)]
MQRARAVVVLVLVDHLDAGRAVRVAVLHFFGGRFADLGDLQPETQRHAGQRMIAVEHHLVLGDIGNGIDHRILFVTVFGHAFELHADFQRLGKTIARLDLDQFGVVVAEGILGLELQLRLEACGMTVECFLDLGERAIIAAVQVDHRLIRFFDQIALRIRQLVHHGHNRVLRDFQFFTP